jgi:hypothetical protein
MQEKDKTIFSEYHLQARSMLRTKHIDLALADYQTMTTVLKVLELHYAASSPFSVLTLKLINMSSLIDSTSEASEHSSATISSAFASPTYIFPLITFPLSFHIPYIHTS